MNVNVTKLFVIATVFFAVSVTFRVAFLVSADGGSNNALERDDVECEVTDFTKSWTDEVGDKFQQFLQDKIFGQKELHDSSGSGFLSLLFQDHGKQDGERANKGYGGENAFFNFFTKFTSSDEKQVDDSNPFLALMDRLVEVGTFADRRLNDSETLIHNDNAVLSLLDRVKNLDEDEHSLIGTDFFRIIHDAGAKALGQLKATFGNILEDLNSSLPISFIYYLTQEDAKRNPSWKRRQHRFFVPVSKSMVLEMHDALYLSQLSYVNTIEDFKTGLKEFQNNEWEVAYGTTDSLPNLPAHFLLIHKNLSPLADPMIQSIFPWERKKESELTATLVIRGTKDISDILADTLLHPVDYRGGLAHGGIFANGKNLADKYLPKLESLLKHSGHDKIRLYLVGHSLGAGAAAIAAMEFNDHDWINVKSIGFGCPSLLSLELSETTKAYVTTVVADSDIIPRMSGASIINLLLDLIEFDWTEMALDDIGFTVDRAMSTFSFASLLPSKEKILTWARAYIDQEVKPKLKKGKQKRSSNLLIPPGDCIHFYRDGVGYTSVFTPCSFFDTIEVSRTLVDDHLIVPGYHRAFMSILRDWKKDYNFDFPHDISAIPV